MHNLQLDFHDNRQGFGSGFNSTPRLHFEPLKLLNFELMRIRIQLFTLLRIRIQLPKMIQIRNPEQKINGKESLIWMFGSGSVIWISIHQKAWIRIIRFQWTRNIGKRNLHCRSFLSRYPVSPPPFPPSKKTSSVWLDFTQRTPSPYVLIIFRLHTCSVTIVHSL